MRVLVLRGLFAPARPALRLLLSVEESATLRAVMRGAEAKARPARPRRLGGWWRRLLRFLRRPGRMTSLEQTERDHG